MQQTLPLAQCLQEASTPSLVSYKINYKEIYFSHIQVHKPETNYFIRPSIALPNSNSCTSVAKVIQFDWYRRLILSFTPEMTIKKQSQP